MFSTDWQKQFNALDPKQDSYLFDALAMMVELAKKEHQHSTYSAERIIAQITQLILVLDERLSKQMDLILHNDDFQALEASWRQALYLATQPVSRQRTKLKILDMSWEEVSNDLNQSYSIKQTFLFNTIGNKELNTLGGQPFGCIAFTHPISMDLDVNSEFDDIYTLGLIGQLGEQTLCTMLASPDSLFFADSGADWLSNTQRIEKVLNGPDYTAWQALRKQPSARFLGLAMPRIKLRQPYKDHRCGFLYQEKGATLWGYANIAFLSTVMKEHHRIGWFGFLKARWNDKEQGALLAWKHKTSELTYSECDSYLFGRIASFYSNQGFISLARNSLTGKLYFSGNNSVWAPSNSDNDKVLAQLQTTLMCCRVAHFLKVQVREMIGNFSDARECEQFLRNWIEKFSSNVNYANEETLAKYPLSKAHIAVNEIESLPGHFSCTLRMVPQYQFDHFNGEVVLTTELGEVGQ
ncbi:type VI secretion system contractile sheath domain-containing protein [Vibrio mediterranei]|uniref:type VI secretion system contractile sheath domain-containing protein n=1 Tax=Vibrio mediterranei TaxID=689 RepID=UPI00148E368A|nr:type VI secretion system contractile sheath large subunit [Vibrio mediterranei]NOI24368.1 type VI secretion system contractile sheath large subunit [Vibrio mediterranei]